MEGQEHSEYESEVANEDDLFGELDEKEDPSDNDMFD